MGGSISMIYYKRELDHFSKTQRLKTELLESKNKKRRDTPLSYSFSQSPTRNYERRFRQLLRAKYNFDLKNE